MNCPWVNEDDIESFNAWLELHNEHIIQTERQLLNKYHEQELKMFDEVCADRLAQYHDEAIEKAAAVVEQFRSRMDAGIEHIALAIRQLKHDQIEND